MRTVLVDLLRRRADVLFSTVVATRRQRAVHQGDFALAGESAGAHESLLPMGVAVRDGRGPCHSLLSGSIRRWLTPSPIHHGFGSSSSRGFSQRNGHRRGRPSGPAFKHLPGKQPRDAERQLPGYRGSEAIGQQRPRIRRGTRCGTPSRSPSPVRAASTRRLTSVPHSRTIRAARRPGWRRGWRGCRG